MGCFHVLAIVNDTAMDMGVQIPVRVPASSSLGCIPSRGLGGPSAHPVSFVEEPPYCFLEWLHHFPFPPAMHKCSSFFAPLTTLVDNGHPKGYEAAVSFVSGYILNHII